MKVAAHARQFRWRWIAGVLFVSLAVAFGAQYIHASRLEAAELKAWAETGRSMESLYVRVAPCGPSPGLFRLEALTERLGFSVVNKSYREAGRPEYLPHLLNLGLDVQHYLRDAFEEDSFVSPPKAVRVFLDEYEETLDAVETLLLSDEPIVWEREPARLDGGPIPPMSNVYTLHFILLARALARSSRGAREDPARPLDAAAKLLDAIRDNPDAQGFTLGLVRMQLAAVRRVGHRSSEARRWVAALDLHEELANAYQLELWREWQVGTRTFPGGENMSKGWPSWAWPLVFELDLQRMPCIVAESTEIRLRLSRWPATSTFDIWDISGGKCRDYSGRYAFFWPIASRAMLDAELTLRVLDLKTGGTLLAPESSRVAPTFEWVYDVVPEGIAVSLSGDHDILFGEEWSYHVRF